MALRKAASPKILAVKLQEIQIDLDDIWKFVQADDENITATDVNMRLARVDKLW